MEVSCRFSLLYLNLQSDISSFNFSYVIFVNKKKHQQTWPSFAVFVGVAKLSQKIFLFLFNSFFFILFKYRNSTKKFKRILLGKYDAIIKVAVVRTRHIYFVYNCNLFFCLFTFVIFYFDFCFVYAYAANWVGKLLYFLHGEFY